MGIIKATAFLVVFWLMSAWVLMLTVGNAHNNWWEFIPPISYASALSLTGVSTLIGVVYQMIKLVLFEK